MMMSSGLQQQVLYRPAAELAFRPWWDSVEDTMLAAMLAIGNKIIRDKCSTVKDKTLGGTSLCSQSVTTIMATTCTCDLFKEQHKHCKNVNFDVFNTIWFYNLNFKPGTCGFLLCQLASIITVGNINHIFVSLEIQLVACHYHIMYNTLSSRIS